MIRKIVPFCSLLLFLAACAGNTTIAPEGSERTCTADADCVVVTTGDICGCDCGNDAINVSDLARYKSELEEKSARCPGTAACDCAAVAAACVQGACKQTTPK